MEKEKFRQWLLKQGRSTIAARNISNRLTRINNYFDVDAAYNEDKCKSLFENLNLQVYSVTDSIIISGDKGKGLNLLKGALKNYVSFLDSAQ